MSPPRVVLVGHAGQLVLPRTPRSAVGAQLVRTVPGGGLVIIAVALAALVFAHAWIAISVSRTSALDHVQAGLR